MPRQTAWFATSILIAGKFLVWVKSAVELTNNKAVENLPKTTPIFAAFSLIRRNQQLN